MHGADSRSKQDTCTTCCYCLFRHSKAKEIKFPFNFNREKTNGWNKKKEKVRLEIKSKWAEKEDLGRREKE